MVLGAAVPLSLYAADELNVFEPNTVISSSAVNENFDIVDARMGVYEDAITVDEESGNVGIGTTSPSPSLLAGGRILHISQSGDDAGIVLERTSNGTAKFELGAGRFGTDGAFAIYDAEDSAYRVAIDTDGNVGIGTTSPGSKLVVSGDVRIGNGTNDTSLRWQGPNNWDAYLDTTNDKFSLRRNSAERMTIDSTGNIGIGTTEPKAPLAIVKGSSAVLALGEEVTAYGDDAALVVHNEGNGYSLYVSDSSADTSPFVIDGEGNVGIGTTGPGQKLHVQGHIVTTGRLQLNSNGNDGWIEGERMDGGSNNFAMKFVTEGSDGFVERMRIVNDGNVGIGTTSPQAQLHVAGNIYADGSITEYSDARLKSDVRPLEDALEGVQCLQGVTYRLKDKRMSTELQLGLIAQEVETCFPEVVSTDDNGYKSVAYARLVVPLIEAVKEQERANQEQRRINDAQQQALLEQQRINDAQQQALEAQRQVTRDLRTDLAETRTALRTTQDALAATTARLERLEAMLSAP